MSMELSPSSSASLLPSLLPERKILLLCRSHGCDDVVPSLLRLNCSLRPREPELVEKLWTVERHWLRAATVANARKEVIIAAK
jgi:hypothetical protein